MTKDEALRIALETLEYAGPSWIESRQPAITAIKAALEAKDEFVAWEQFYPDIGKPQIAFNAEVVGYVAPQCTWVGLTNEDKQKLAAEHHDWESLCFAIEAKLKEKNT